jgi:rod shape-determining protein MreC
METLISRYRNVTILALALLAQLLLLGYQVKTERDVRLIRLWGVTAITPVARVLDGGYERIAGAWRNYIWLREARRESEALRAERDRLKLENESLRQALGAAGRLEVLTSYRQNLASQTLVAEVVGVSRQDVCKFPKHIGEINNILDSCFAGMMRFGWFSDFFHSLL